MKILCEAWFLEFSASVEIALGVAVGDFAFLVWIGDLFGIRSRVQLGGS